MRRAFQSRCVVDNGGRIADAFESPQRLECWRVCPQSTDIVPVVVRISPCGHGRWHEAYEISGKRRVLTRRGYAYFTTYAAARSYLICDAKLEHRCAVEATKRRLKEWRIASRIPRSSPKARAS